MRAFTTAVLLALSAPAAAQTPAPAAPSRTLERALALYDRSDYLSAHIELHKVIAGETADSQDNRQRAQFTTGKILFQLRLYVASAAVFEAIRLDPGHRHAAAVLEWQVALARRPPLALIMAEPLAQYSAADLADPSLAPAREELALLRALYSLERGDHAPAVAELGLIKRDSEFYPRAQLATGMTELLRGKSKAALSAFNRVPDDSDVADLARLATGQALVRAGDFDGAMAAYARVGRGPLAARAAWEASWARLHERGQGDSVRALAAVATTPVLDPDGPEPVILREAIAFDLCSGKQTALPDALARFRAAAPALAAELDALAAEEPDDNAAFFTDRARHLLAGKGRGLTPRALALARAALRSPAMQPHLALLAELDRELAAYSRSDRAWQTTAAAADVLTELTLQRALVEADCGKLARDRLARLAHDVNALARAAAQLPGPVAASATPGDGLTVLCR